MSRSFLPFAMPDIGDDEIAEVLDTLRSGWLTTGPKTRQFESDFAAYLGGNVHAVAVNSATAGLHLAMDALEIGPGDEVITTTHTFTATAEVIRYMGAEPVFVDIELKTYCIDPAQIEAAITPRTRAIIPVHYGGLPCDMDRISAIARKHKIAIVEDAAHALPATYNKKLIGSLDSDVTVFSFYSTKTITTGEGGMLVTRSDKIAARAKVMRLHGIDRDSFDRYTASRPQWYYQVVAPGFKYNMMDISAAIGIHQLRRANSFLEKRQLLANRYSSALKDLPLVLPPSPPGDCQHSWHLYVVRLTDQASCSRDDLITRLSEQGISSSVHYVPLHRHPYWRDSFNLKTANFPNSELLFQTSLSLPIYTKMTDQDQHSVISAIETILN